MIIKGVKKMANSVVQVLNRPKKLKFHQRSIIELARPNKVKSKKNLYYAITSDLYKGGTCSKTRKTN